MKRNKIKERETDNTYEMVYFSWLGPDKSLYILPYHLYMRLAPGSGNHTNCFSTTACISNINLRKFSHLPNGRKSRRTNHRWFSGRWFSRRLQGLSPYSTYCISFIMRKLQWVVQSEKIEAALQKSFTEEKYIYFLVFPDLFKKNYSAQKPGNNNLKHSMNKFCSPQLWKLRIKQQLCQIYKTILFIVSGEFLSINPVL